MKFSFVSLFIVSTFATLLHMTKTHKITLIFPEQLFYDVAYEPGSTIVIIEDPLIFGDQRYPLRTHKSKRVFHRATMKAYEAYLKTQKYTVKYHAWQPGLTYDDALSPYACTEIVMFACSDVIRMRRLRRWAEEKNVTLTLKKSPYFLNTTQENKPLLDVPKPRMHTFYKHQRVNLGILMEADGTTPLGGKWSYDEDNRKKVPRKEIELIPGDLTRTENHYIAEAEEYVNEKFPDAPGSGYCYFPVTREDALTALDDFLSERFLKFGPYEDAMVAGQSRLYHSTLSPLLNCGLLTPREVINAALTYWENLPDRMNHLPSIEGFIRQIIGWREYMRGIYDFHGIALRTSNAWDHKRSLPPSFYDGTTDIEPLDDIITRTLKTGYAHHIERLMVLGNIMFLLRISPDEIYQWFSEMYLDAYDWVMVPNVYGMSQSTIVDFITTKPYICGSNYIKKMSNHTCSRDEGSWCDEMDTLYWQFLIDHEDLLKPNHRWRMMYSRVAAYSADDRSRYQKHFNDIISRLS